MTENLDFHFFNNNQIQNTIFAPVRNEMTAMSGMRERINGMFGWINGIQKRIKG
jgi:hypothetical protein